MSWILLFSLGEKVRISWRGDLWRTKFHGHCHFHLMTPRLLWTVETPEKQVRYVPPPTSLVLELDWYYVLSCIMYYVPPPANLDLE